MVRVLSFIILVIIISSCPVRTNEFGLARKSLNYKKINISNAIFYKIDTLSVYKYKGYIHNNNFKKIKISKYLRYMEFIKFFKKGRISFISIKNNEIINRQSFNPKKSGMGRYFVRNNNFYVNHYTFGDGFGSLSNC